MDYNDMTKEELLGILDHPEEIESGDNPWEDDDREYQLTQVRNILVDKYGMKRKDLA